MAHSVLNKRSRVRIQLFYVVISFFYVLQCLDDVSHAARNPWAATPTEMAEEIPKRDDGKQIVEEGRFPMIGNGPWTVQFNLTQTGDIQVVKKGKSLGKITRDIHNQQQNKKTIIVERDIDPILGAFDAYANAEDDLHQNINYNETRNQIQKDWDQDRDRKLKEAERYLKDNGVKIKRLSDQQIRDLCMHMWTYDKKRGDIIRELNRISKRQKAWRINVKALTRDSASEIARKYLDLYSLEFVKERLAEKFKDGGWQKPVRTYLDRLGIKMPADPVKEELRLLQKIDALQIAMHGRLAASKRNVRRFNASLDKSEKNAILEKITFHWKFSMWPLAHPADPNSRIKAAAPVPANLKDPKQEVNLVLYGRLDPAKDDNADWWEVAGFDENRLEITFEPKLKVTLRGPLQAQAAGNQRKRSLIRVVAKGEGPVNYVITIRSKDHDHDPKKASQVYEPVMHHFPKFPS